MVIKNKAKQIQELNGKLNPPEELGGQFLPNDHKKQFEIMFLSEMPSMNEPDNWDEETNYNFNITARDEFLKEMMVKYRVGGSYVTDISKKRDKPRKPTKEEIDKYIPFLLNEIEIISPRAIIVLGKRTYEQTFEPFVKEHISKDIRVDYVFHYSSQVPRDKFEKRFKDIIRSIN